MDVGIYAAGYIITDLMIENGVVDKSERKVVGDKIAHELYNARFNGRLTATQNEKGKWVITTEQVVELYKKYSSGQSVSKSVNARTIVMGELRSMI